MTSSIRPALSHDIWMGPLSLAGDRERTPPGWLEQVASLGGSAVELDPRLALPAPEFAMLLADHGLSLAGAAYVGGLLDLTLADEQRRLAAVVERSLADRLAGEGAVLAYLPRPGTFVLTEAEIDLLMASTDTSVHLALDSGAAAIAGDDIVALMRRHAARLRYLRVQAAAREGLEQARARGWSWPRLVRAGVLTPPTPEMSDPDPAALAAVLADIGYVGWIVAAAERQPDHGRLPEIVPSALAALEALRRPPSTARP